MKPINLRAVPIFVIALLLTMTSARAQMNTAQPAVSIQSIDGSASEPGTDTGVFKVFRSGDISTNLVVYYSISETTAGRALNGVDYVSLPMSVVIPAGSSNAFITVQPIDDSIVETTEAVTLLLSTNAAYRLLSPTTAMVNILDNETNHPPVVSMVTPADGASLADPPSVLLSAEASDVDGNAPRVSFYCNSSLMSVEVRQTNNVYSAIWTNVPAGQFSLTAKAQDGLNQGIWATSAPVTVTVTKTNLSPYVYLKTPTNGSRYTNITKLSLSAYAYPGDSTRRVTNVDFILGTTVLASVPSLTVPSSPNFFSFLWNNPPPGEYALTARAVDDAGGATVSASVSITVVSQSNTTSTVVTVMATDSSAAEDANSASGANTGTFKISRSGNTNSSLTVSFELGGTATYGIDYPQIPTSVSIPAGTFYTHVSIVPIDDMMVENTETVVLTLKSNSSYVLGEGRVATVSIADNDQAQTNLPPVVYITMPTNNATFMAPANIMIYANATDPGGAGTNGHWVDTVEFFAGTNSIGIATNCLACANIQNPFHLYWTNVPAGSYALTAKATDNEGASSVSEPVHINVITQDTNRAVVSITATDAEASEGSNSTNTGTNTATFRISRTGNTNVAITVHYSVEGTAANGIDYQQIGTSVALAAGVNQTNIVIRPIDDLHAEGMETVVLRVQPPVCAAVFPPPPECYEVGTPSEAIAKIYDNDIVTNAPPAVVLISPTNGAVFFSPALVEIQAQASDSDGSVSRVDFFRGDWQIGSDTTTPYSMVWSNVQPGSYGISARAVDNLGAMRWSTPVFITVKSPNELSFVRRALPLWYVPGVKLLVHLRAEPKTNTTWYAVNDLPPTNWVVGAISDGGTYDAADGKVKFGPFNDAVARTLTYEVTPPDNATGEKRFIGAGIANDIVSPILGASFIHRAPPHPADRNPTNFVMSLTEVTAYSTAWRRCERWAISPNPLPVSYVSRAGYLYVKGGGYALSTNYPTPFPPMLWVSTNASVTMDISTTGDMPWTTNHPNIGTAVSAMPTNYTVGVSFNVNITVTPSSGVSAYAVEDRVPYGWVVSSVSHEGAFCPTTSKVRWGAFLDNVPRTLSYIITPTTNNAPSVAEFAGVASFDGINIPITGQRRTSRATTIQPARLQSVQPLDDGNRLLTFSGEAGVAYTLEATSDLSDWQPIEELLNNDGVLQYIDLATNNTVRFYRAVPRE